MSKNVCTRRDFLRYMGIGVTVSTLQISNNVSATTHTSSIDEILGLKEFKEYAKNVVDAMKEARAYVEWDKERWKTLAELMSTDIYNDVIKGKKVVVALSPLQQGELLSMFVDLGKSFGGYLFSDIGIGGHLMGDNAGFLIYDNDNMEILNFSGSGNWYHFEKVIEAKSNLDRLICLRPVPFNPVSGYCPIGDALFDAQKQIFEREGYYAKLTHEYFVRRMNEARVNSNSLYREILAEMIKELKKIGQIK